MLPQTDVRDGEIEGLRRRIDQIRGEIYKRLTPWQRVLVARHPERPYLLDYVERLFTEFVELHGDRRFADDGAIVCGFARYHGAPVHGLRPPEGPRHEAEGAAQLRLRAAGGLPQGAARDADGRQVRPADHRLRRHAGGLPRRRVRGARHRRGHRPEPARDGHPRRADHRRHHRRGRQRRRARPGHRRPRADAGVRRLQRHSARGLRRDPVARRQPQGRGRRGAEDHRAGSDRARHRRRHRAPSRSAAPTRIPTPRRPPSIWRSSAALAEVAALDTATRLQTRYDRFRRLGALGDAIIDTAAPAAARRPGRSASVGENATLGAGRLGRYREPGGRPRCVRSRRARRGAGHGARRPAGRRPPAVPARHRHAGGGGPLPVAVGRSPPRSVPADRSRRRGRAPAGRDRAQGAHRHPRRLRRRRGHVDGDPAPHAGAARRRRHALPARAPARRLRPAAGQRRSPARRRRARHRLGRLRHPQRRRRRSRPRAGHRPDHQRPPRARGDAAARARGDQPEAARTAPIPTSTSPASASR